MFDRIITSTASLGLAAMVTLALASGIDSLATHQHAAAEMAQAASAATTVQNSRTAKPVSRIAG